MHSGTRRPSTSRVPVSAPDDMNAVVLSNWPLSFHDRVPRITSANRAVFDNPSGTGEVL